MLLATASRGATRDQVHLLQREGNVQGRHTGNAAWLEARSGETFRPGEGIRTLAASRATVQMQDLTTLRLGPLSEFWVKPQPDSQPGTLATFLRGIFYFFHRERPTDTRYETPTVSAAIRGTEFQIEVTDTGRTLITVFDGIVELSNPFGMLQLVSGEQGLAEAGQPPLKTSSILVRHELIQWSLYYPGVLNAKDLRLDPSQTQALSASIQSYIEGQPAEALQRYPANREPSSISERIYLAAILLAAGEVPRAQSVLLPVGAPDRKADLQGRLAGALQGFVALVSRDPNRNELLTPPPPQATATEWLIDSYREQQDAQLPAALRSVRQALQRAPDFGYAWVRLAELQFSSGRVREAEESLTTGLRLAPKNAQAVALQGFLAAARRDFSAAEAAFVQAIELDSAQGNAWLGLALCRIHRGEVNEGRLALMIAATLEPQRALIRSYLGKAWKETHENLRAIRELELAESLDPGDPTAAFYLGLVRQEENRLNESLAAFERSKLLNDNRKVYRSRLLLDQDLAVRRVNLAIGYRDLGMTDWSLREASKAVGADPLNWSAHRFLANSFNELRDPGSVNLRYETAWFTEYLLANLLAPPGANTVSQRVSQQEYFQFFDRPEWGIYSESAYLSRGAWAQSLVNYGHAGRWEYALEGDYLRDRGEGKNRDQKDRALALDLKYELSPGETLVLQGVAGQSDSGDLALRADPARVNAGLRNNEERLPVSLLGYHREWSPESHTLVLGSYIRADLQVYDPASQSLYFETNLNAPILLEPIQFTQDYSSEFRLGTVEMQHLLTLEPHSLSFGLRAQAGWFDLHNLQRNPSSQQNQFLLGGPAANQQEGVGLDRVSIYAYDTWKLTDQVTAVGGLAYDFLDYPVNFRFAPLTEDRRRLSRWSPKAGLIWSIDTDLTLRSAFTRSLAGASLDQSVRLEPVQVAGFNQAYRSLIPEDLEGANSAATLDALDLAVEQRFRTRTYVTLSSQWLNSSLFRQRGAFGFDPAAAFLAQVTSVGEHLRYDERSVQVRLNQLIEDCWAVGMGYRFTHSRLNGRLLGVPEGLIDNTTAAGVHSPESSTAADLHEASLRCDFNHPTGFFARSEWTAFFQRGDAHRGNLATSDSWQHNLTVGWRFAQRRAEVSVSVLNLWDQAYRLEPISPLTARPSERLLALAARLRF